MKKISEHQKIAVILAKLIPSYILSDVSTMFEYYKDDLQINDMNIHKTKFDSWKFVILKM